MNKAFFENALSGAAHAGARLDVEVRQEAGHRRFTGDKRVFQDGTRTVEMHVIKGLPHADGIVVGYLPKEKILAYADMFNLPPAARPGARIRRSSARWCSSTTSSGSSSMSDRIMSVHSLNPDRLTSVADIKASLGRK